MAVYRVPFTWVSFTNLSVQLCFDYLVAACLPQYFGPKSLLYFLLSSFLAGSLHPLAGHFIAEHYVYETVPASARGSPTAASDIPVPETFSYYGPLNLLTYNVGLHNEHHDFPAVPWTRLPQLNRIASEFYGDLPHHRSWTYALWRFIWDDQVGITCRVKRKAGGRVVGGGSKNAPAKAEEWKQDEIEA